MFLDWTLPGRGSKFQIYLPVKNIQDVHNNQIDVTQIKGIDEDEEEVKCEESSESSLFPKDPCIGQSQNSDCM